MLRTYTRKAYLSRPAHTHLDDFLDQARYLYNESLAERRDAWEREKRTVTYLHQQAKLTQRRADPHWRRFFARVQRSILKRLDRAYQHFFKRGGYPRFKSWRTGIHSFEDPAPANGWVVKVSPRHTTQQCSGCGAMPCEKLDLGQRVYCCYACGMTLDRDLNAAINILHRGLSSDSAGMSAEMKGGYAKLGASLEALTS